MKKTLALFLLLLISLPTFALDNGQVMYAGGTITTLKEGVLGKLDTTSQSVLGFESADGKLVIPYATIDSFEYSKRVAHHLGVLPAIAVGLVKQRQHRHFFRISYHEGNNPPQVVILQVPKQMPATLLAILQARAPQGCKPKAFVKCGVQPS